MQFLVLPILNLTAPQQSTNFNNRTLYRTVTAKFLCDRALTGLNLCNVRQQVSSFQYDYMWWVLDCLQLWSTNALRFYDDAASQLWIISTCILQYFIGAAANQAKELVATGLVSSRFPIRVVHAFLFSSIRSTCPVHHPPLPERPNNVSWRVYNCTARKNTKLLVPYYRSFPSNIISSP